MLTHSEKSSKTISTSVSQQDYDRIEELVSDGLFSDFNDFFNEAIVEKLGGMEPITLRDIPYSQQRDEIIKYAEEHGEVDALEISDELLLDVFEVNDIMVELIKEGILEEL